MYLSSLRTKKCSLNILAVVSKVGTIICFLLSPNYSSVSVLFLITSAVGFGGADTFAISSKALAFLSLEPN